MLRFFALTFLLASMSASIALAGLSTPVGRPSAATNALVFTRDDGSTINFPGGQAWVWCAPYDEGNVSAPALHIVFFKAGAPIGWLLQVVLADLETGTPLTFPNIWTWPNPKGATFFVLDSPNEASSGEIDSAGEIVFAETGCQEGDTVTFVANDVVLGSEFGDGTPVFVSGTFSATVTGKPVAIARESWGAVRGRF